MKIYTDIYQINNYGYNFPRKFSLVVVFWFVFFAKNLSTCNYTDSALASDGFFFSWFLGAGAESPVYFK